MGQVDLVGLVSHAAWDSWGLLIGRVGLIGHSILALWAMKAMRSQMGTRARVVITRAQVAVARARVVITRALGPGNNYKGHSNNYKGQGSDCHGRAIWAMGPCGLYGPSGSDGPCGPCRAAHLRLTYRSGGSNKPFHIGLVGHESYAVLDKYKGQTSDYKGQGSNYKGSGSN